MEELGDEDVLDPHPDIHSLFCYYNSLYFGDALGACSVDWSTSRMTRNAGVCHYRQRGACEIRISEPLLKFRSTSDLKNTLLHEMIHAFLWIENRNMDHSDHGHNFQKVMNDINGSSIDDNQRPAGGYNITVYHDFHAEVDSYQGHQWMCQSCGDLIKRAMNRAPSASDCTERVKHDGFCGNPCCHWHQHKMRCSGEYTKIAEPPGYEGKGSKGKHKHQKDGLNELSRASREKEARKHQTAGDKDESDVKKVKTITNFFPVLDAGNVGVDNHSSTGVSRKHGHHGDSKAIVPKLPNDLVLEKSARGIRSHTSRRKRKLTDVEQKNYGHTSNYTVMSRWLDWYAEEEEVHTEPLINKRTERRKKHRMLMHSKRKTIEDETVADTCPTEDIDLEVAESVYPVATRTQDPVDVRGASQLQASGFCEGADSPQVLIEKNNGVHMLNQSGKVNILEISDD